MTDEEFSRAARTYGDTLYRVAYHALQNRADAEDVMQTVLLRLYAELPFSQIAESMKITENSAKVLYHRAKKLLLEELKNEYFM